MNSRLNNSISNLILIIMIALNVLISFNSTLYNFYTDYSIYLTSMFIFSLLIFNIQDLKPKEIGYIFFLAVYLLLDSVIYTHSYGSSATILLSILLIITISKIRISREFFSILHVLMIILNVFLFYKSFAYKNNWIINSNSINSNQLAMNMFISFLYIMILSRNFKLSKIIEIVFIFINILGINNFGSRTTYIALFFFLIMRYLISKEILFKKAKFRMIYYLVVIFSIIVPCVYVYIWKNSMNFGIDLMGKRFFTGREIMWNELFNSLNSIPKVLFGLGDNMVYSNGLLNTHNVSLHIIMSCGLIGCIFYYMFIFNKFELGMKSKFGVNTLRIDCLIAFLATIVYGYFENPLQTNRMLFIYLFISIFINEHLINTENEFKILKK